MADRPRCESCGAWADVRLADQSTWCDACDESAVNLGYGRRRKCRLVLIESEL